MLLLQSKHVPALSKYHLQKDMKEHFWTIWIDTASNARVLESSTLPATMQAQLSEAHILTCTC